MRYGKDDQDTHEPMQLSRHRRKYMNGQAVRHAGQNRLKHRDKDNKPGEDTPQAGQ